MTPSDTILSLAEPSGRQLAAVGAAPGGSLPEVFLRGQDGGRRFWEFFTVNIRNKNTRRAYFVAVLQFSTWCDRRKPSLERIEPMHVAAYIEQLGKAVSKPTVKQHLAAIRMLFDWLAPARSCQRTPPTPSADPGTV